MPTPPTQEREVSCHQLLMDNHLWCNEVMQTQHEMPCLFYDILSLNSTGTVDPADSYDRKRRRIQRGLLAPTQLCAAHSWAEGGSDCCQVPRADFGCSGLPCTDMSRAGLKQKRDGPTNAVYVTHGKFVCDTGVPLLVLECTPATWCIIPLPS